MYIVEANVLGEILHLRVHKDFAVLLFVMFDWS